MLVENLPINRAPEFIDMAVNHEVNQQVAREQRKRYSKTFSKEPSWWGIGLKSFQDGKLYSIFLDTTHIRLLPCVAEFNNFIEYPLNELRSYKIERGHVRLIRKLKFVKISLEFENNLLPTLYIVSLEERHLSPIEERFPRVLDEAIASARQNQSDDFTEESDNDQIKAHSIVYWDYDNLSLGRNVSIEQDTTAQSLKQVLSEFQPIYQSYCVSAKSLTDLEVKKINAVTRESEIIEIIRVPKGKNSTDKKMIKKAESMIGKIQAENFILITADGDLSVILDQIDNIDCTVFVIYNNHNISSKYIERLPETQLIDLSTFTTGITTNQLVSCSFGKCKIKIANSNVNNHNIRFHLKQPCPVCKKEKSGKRGVEQHARAKHYICTCKNIFATKEALKQHKKAKSHK